MATENTICKYRLVKQTDKADKGTPPVYAEVKKNIGKNVFTTLNIFIFHENYSKKHEMPSC